MISEISQINRSNPRYQQNRASSSANLPSFTSSRENKNTKRIFRGLGAAALGVFGITLLSKIKKAKL